MTRRHASASNFGMWFGGFSSPCSSPGSPLVSAASTCSVLGFRRAYQASAIPSSILMLRPGVPSQVSSNDQAWHASSYVARVATLYCTMYSHTVQSFGRPKMDRPINDPHSVSTTYMHLAVASRMQRTHLHAWIRSGEMNLEPQASGAVKTAQ